MGVKTNEAPVSRALKAPPGENARVRGEIEITGAQERRFREFLKSMVQNEAKEDVVQLRVAYVRGLSFRTILQARDQFGERSARDIAEALGRHRSTISASLKFANLITKEQLAELCNMARPPSWRMMQCWTGLPESQRAPVLQDILAGKIDTQRGRRGLEELIRRGPRAADRPKRTRSPLSAFNQLEARARVMLEALAEMPQAAKTVESVTDTIQRRELRKTARQTLEGMKQLRKRLDATIAECEKLLTAEPDSKTR